MIKILKNYNLKDLNTFNFPIIAKHFVEIKNEDELLALFNTKEFKSGKYLFLGYGSNVLFLKNYNGLIISNRLKGIDIIKEDKNFVYVRAMGGELWHDLVLFSVEKGLWGIENMSLIPGSVGASPVQNIGAYGVELKDILEEVEAYDIFKSKKKLVKKVFKNKECKFGYRDSIFKSKFKNKYFISAIVIKLSKKKNENISYKALEEYIKKNNLKITNSKDIAYAVGEIRKSKLPNPKDLGNAGSFFKNTYINQKKLKELLLKYPDIPYFKEGKKIKIPTGWLIESCNLKGKRFKNVGIYEKQALILVHYGGGRGIDVKKLSDKIIKDVYKKFGILITREVNLI